MTSFTLIQLIVDRRPVRLRKARGSSAGRPFESCRHCFHEINFSLAPFLLENLLLHKCSERSWKQKGLDKPLRPCKLSHVANWGPGKTKEDSRRRRGRRSVDGNRFDCCCLCRAAGRRSLTTTTAMPISALMAVRPLRPAECCCSAERLSLHGGTSIGPNSKPLASNLFLEQSLKLILSDFEVKFWG